jgi:hypothetical protein
LRDVGVYYNDQVKEDEVGKPCSTNKVEEKCITILVGKPEGKRPLGRPRFSWVDNIKTDLREIRWDLMDLIDLGSG